MVICICFVIKHGVTIFELSNPSSKYYIGGYNMDIPPVEPAYLVHIDWISVYNALGRDKNVGHKRKDLTIAEANNRKEETIRVYDFTYDEILYL